MLVSIVVPCKDEEEALPLFIEELKKVTKELDGYTFEYIFVDDGSTDNTLKIIKNNHNFKYISFTRNFGKEAALYAGLERAKGDYVCVMDADMQDPPSLLIQMLEIIKERNIDCVAARRINRKGEGIIRSACAKLFYKLINSMSTYKIESGARDFRLMSRRMVNSVIEISEYNRFSKGIFSFVGYETYWLEYENVQRIKGKTKWNFLSLLRYGIDGIVGFTSSPLVIASYLGMLMFVLAFLGVIFVVVRKLIYGDPTTGWASLVCILLFTSGIQLLCIGIIGEYISKTYLETKRRPLYIVKEENGQEKGSS